MQISGVYKIIITVYGKKNRPCQMRFLRHFLLFKQLSKYFSGFDKWLKKARALKNSFNLFQSLILHEAEQFSLKIGCILQFDLYRNLKFMLRMQMVYYE